MIWPNARRIVAAVQYAKSVRNLAEMNPPRDSVCSELTATNFDIPVSKTVLSGCPYPAIAPSIYASPEPSDFFFCHILHHESLPGAEVQAW